MRPGASAPLLEGIPPMSTDLTIAHEILAQLGGTNRLNLMLGLKARPVGGERDLTFFWKCKALKSINGIRITLEPSDTYKVEFLRLRSLECKTVETVEDVYAEDLREVFYNHTGLTIVVPRVVGINA